MSAKLKLTSWIAISMFILSTVTMAFIIWVNEADVVDDAIERLTETVLHNEDSFEFERGSIDWEDVDFYTRGVYCAFYDEKGSLLRGMTVDELGPGDIAFDEYELQTVTVDGDTFYIYDAYLEIADISKIWIRGIVPENDDSGIMHTISVMAYTLLPSLLILSVAGGWLISKRAFAPMEELTKTANSIKDGDDLTKRIDLQTGGSEMVALGRTFDDMFDRLERSFNAERQFSSDASHELRTPIAVIKAYCDRARRKASSREDFLGAVDVIEAQADKMSELVSQLLSLTRLQQGTELYPMVTEDLSLLVNEVCDDFAPAEARGISLTRDIQTGVTAELNAFLMARLLQNLLQNAFKYGRENGSIGVCLRESGGAISLSVSDDGIGIAPEDRDKIWQRFWQADTSRSGDGGSGLGLAMVAEIARLHGGSMSLESAPDKGSTFTLTLKKQ
ncbi:MAG: HAMP domain-containing histidine kinase [Oscillospiraceae bacterium]|nr:HAMP domain-containing histidine kinase [Oscillospiraceae bacterium]